MSFHKCHSRSPSSTSAVFPEAEGRLVTFKIKMDSDGYPLFPRKSLLLSISLFVCSTSNDLVFYFKAFSSFEAAWISRGLSPSTSPLSPFFPDFFFLGLSFQRFYSNISLETPVIQLGTSNLCNSNCLLRIIHGSTNTHETCRIHQLLYF